MSEIEKILSTIKAYRTLSHYTLNAAYNAENEIKNLLEAEMKKESPSCELVASLEARKDVIAEAIKIIEDDDLF